MVARAIAIIEGLAGFTPSQALMLRVAEAYLPDGVDPETATNLEKATYFVRGVRGQVKGMVLNAAEREASNTAMQAARDEVNANVDLGND
jgi:hypothetical protein